MNTRNAGLNKGKGVARNTPDAAASDARGRTLDENQQEQLNQQLYQLSGSGASRFYEVEDDDDGEDAHGTPRANSMRHASDPEGSIPPRQTTQGRATPGGVTVQGRAFNPAGSHNPIEDLGTTRRSPVQGRASNPAGLDSSIEDLGAPNLPGRGRDSLPLGERQHGIALPPGLAMSTSATGYIQSLLDQLFIAEKSGASAEEIARLERRVDLASKALMPVASSTERLRDPLDAASRLMRTLNNVSPKPKLGADGRVPTPQQVH